MAANSDFISKGALINHLMMVAGGGVKKAENNLTSFVHSFQLLYNYYATAIQRLCNGHALAK